MADARQDSDPEEKLPFGGYHVDSALADGEGVVVYVMDTGYHPGGDWKTKSNVFFPGKVEFPQQDGGDAPGKLKPIGDITREEGKEWPRFKVNGQTVGDKVYDRSSVRHGPEVAAVIGANAAGVAPRCRIAPLRCNTLPVAGVADEEKRIQEEAPDIEVCIKSCQIILDYHQKKHPGKPAVINCSFDIFYRGVVSKLKHNDENSDTAETRAVELILDFEASIQKLIQAGMIVVAGAGNAKQTLNTSWQHWASNSGENIKTDMEFRAPQCFDNVLVAGGLGRNGKVWEDAKFDQGSGTGALVSYYLLADRLANPLDDDDTISGISFATACLSGIIACILSSRYYQSRFRTNAPEPRKGAEQILQEISQPFVDPKGNKCRAFFHGAIVLK